ncbi:extracellular solute-binding protein [Paenibacillus periandrae]|uniref:extracellular solute-binding protein n=1 Tax=Paenibacillus periandrae TaxID=1761741 RepID=UPI001F09532B|nr:extracellular solute-binding protein [Paenibacillus periandrae]
MKNRMKITAALMVTTMMGTLVMACSNSTPQTSSDMKSNTDNVPKGVTTYPIQTDKTLTYWGELISTLVGVKPTHADVPFYQEWQKRTGVSLKFIEPPTNQAKEALNVILASGDLPDMMEYDFFSFPGGPEKAIKDGYILRLNDAIDKYAPNFKKFLKENPEIDKMVKTDSGSYYSFPFIRADPLQTVYQGPVVRKDWLDELGLPVPTTISEWTTVLRAFKEKKGAAAPLSLYSKPRVFNDLNNGGFVGAFGVTRNFFVEDGQVKFGPAEKGYKDFLALFHDWYAEGLLDKNIATVDAKILDANIANNATGASVAIAGRDMGRWLPMLEAKDAKASLVPTPYPVLNKGDRPKFGQKDLPFYYQGGMVVISATTKNVELAVKLLDYGYGEEGKMFHNFGTEGVSYKMENGYPKYTDLVMKNPDKLSPAQALSLYMRSPSSGPFIQDRRYTEQYLSYPSQQEALKIWRETDMDKYRFPPATATPEESTEMAKIMTDMNTLVDEMTLKFILGNEPVSNFDKYVEKMKSIRLDRAIEIQKNALDRYNKR